MTQPIFPPTYPKDGSYADLLLWHLYVWGTRPGGSLTVRGRAVWKEVDFIDIVFKGLSTTRPKRTYEAWIGEGRCGAPGAHFPRRIAKALFGGEPQFAVWEAELESARENSLGEGENVKSINVKAALAELETASTLASSEPNIPSIPHLTPYFMGRDRERDQLVDLLIAPDGPSAILVQGGPGIGKTELTKAIAHHANVTARFGERRYFAPLEHANSASKMREVIIDAVGCDPKLSFPEALDTLRGKQSLLVLDNLETPWEFPEERAKTEDVLADLSATPGLSLVASFRGREKVGGLRWSSKRLLDPLGDLASIELFADIVGDDRVRADPHLDKFIRALGGVPLALCLVARHAYGETPLASLWDEWVRIGDRLAKDPDFEDSRLTSLSRSIELSLGSVRMKSSLDARQLFALLGRSPGGLATEDCGALLGDDADAARRRLLRVGLAVERSGWIDLLPPIREHAYRHSVMSDEETKRRINYFISLTAKYFDKNRPRYISYASDIRRKLSNILCAFKDALDKGLAGTAVGSLGSLASLIKHLNASRSIFDELVNIFEDMGDLSGQASCKMAKYDCQGRSLGEIDETYLLQALDLYQKADDTTSIADCFQRMAFNHQWRFRYKKAAILYKDAARLYKISSQIQARTQCFVNLGRVELKFERYRSAIKYTEAALRIYSTLEDELHQADCWLQLGEIHFERDGMYGRALDFYEKALPIFERNGDISEINLCLERASFLMHLRKNRWGIDDSLGPERPIFRAVWDQYNKS